VLAEGPKSVTELIDLGIPPSSAAYDIKALLKRKEVKQLTQSPVRTYALINQFLPQSEAFASLILRNIRSTDKAVAYQAAKDLDELSMQGWLDAGIIKYLVYEAKNNPRGSIYDALRRQAALAKTNENKPLAT
jgi:hypothetical protein